MRRLNERHAASRAHDPALEARIQSFELAYRMQGEAAEAFDISREPDPIRELYGPGTQARQLLITRRLLERGVRFIQVWSGAGQPWDDHENIAAHHRQLADEWDQAIAAFLTDLKQRGLFDQVLVDLGRRVRPDARRRAAGALRPRPQPLRLLDVAGRRRRPRRLRPRRHRRARLRRRPADKVHVHDLHATILHLLGFDHEKLTYRYAGRDFRLTDVHGRVVKELLA